MALKQAEIERLLAMTDEEYRAAKLLLPLKDTAMIDVERVKLPPRPKNELEQAAMEALSLAGVSVAAGGVIAAGALDRVKNLLGGKQTRYEGVRLSLAELVDRLEALYGETIHFAFTGDQVVAFRLSDNERLVAIRFGFSGGGTNVTVSGAGDELKEAAIGATKGAAQRLLNGGDLMSTLEGLGRKVISEAITTALNVPEFKAIIGVLEKYGAEELAIFEDATRKAEAEARRLENERRDQAVAQDRADRKVVICNHCGYETSALVANCDNCSAPRS